MDLFNSDELEDFRTYLVAYMREHGYKNGFEIYKAFIASKVFLETDQYDEFQEVFFKKLYGS